MASFPAQRKDVLAKAIILSALFVLLICSNAAAAEGDHSDPATIRHHLNQILSQPEYNRVYEENVVPQWWTDLWKRAADAAGEALKWLVESLSLQGEQAGRVASFVFACLVVVAFLALLVLIIRRISRRPRGLDNRPGGPLAASHQIPSARPLIAEAAKLADSGDYRGAFRCVYLASLAHMDDIGALRFERSRTNWEYLRELDDAGRNGLLDQLRPMTLDFDRVFYGHESCTLDDYTRAFAAYQNIANEVAA